MLSIWKFVRSSSISWLSWTTNPNCSKIVAISAIAWMLGWSEPRRSGRPGVVTSSCSRTRRDASSSPPTEARRSAMAASMAVRTALAAAPTRGRSSAGSAPIPRSTPVSSPFLPSTSTSSASSAAVSAAPATNASARSRRASRSRVRSARFTGLFDSGCGVGSADGRTSGGRESRALGRHGRRGLLLTIDQVAESRALGDLDDPLERPGIPDGDVGEDLAVQPDLGGLQSGDEPAVRHAVEADRGVDPDDPQATEVALPLLAIPGRIGHGVQECLARRLDEARARSLATFGRIQEPLVPLVGGYAPLDSSHEVLMLLEIREQALNLPGVGAADDRLPGVAASSARGLDLEVVTSPGPDPDDLAAAGLADPLLGGLVALHLRHGAVTLPSLPARRPVKSLQVQGPRGPERRG